MSIVHSILPVLSPVLAFLWTYRLITKIKLDKKIYAVLLLLYLVSVLFPHLFFLPIVVLCFFMYSKNKKMSTSHSIFYTAFSIFWITLLSTAMETTSTFLFEEFTNTYVNWVHYFSFFLAALINFGIIKWFKIDFYLLQKNDMYIQEKIIKPSNRIIVSCVIIIIIWVIILESLDYAKWFAVFGSVYFSLLTSMYFIFMGLLSTKIKEYLAMILEREKDQRYQELKKYIEDVESMQIELAGFKHDMKNIWISFSEVIQSKDQEFIETTYNNIKEKLEVQVEEADKVSHELSNLKDTITKGLLHQKHSLAKDLKVEMKIDIKNEIKIIPMEMLNFIRMFGIFLDNAIEEALESERKEVFVGFVSEKENLVIEITNSTDKEHIPISKIFKEGYTTKLEEGGNRGKGLAIVSNIIKETPQAILNTDLKHGLFSQTLKIWMEYEN